MSSVKHAPWWALMADVVAALQWGPKTKPEVWQICGSQAERHARTHGMVDELHRAGAVYISGYNGPHAVYAMQSKPFEREDVAPPAHVRERLESRGKFPTYHVLLDTGEDVSVPVAAKRMGRPKSTIYYWIRTGVMVPVKPGTKEPIQRGRDACASS